MIDLSATIARTLEQGGGDDAIAFDGRWRSWTWVRDMAQAMDDAVAGASAVGLVARNRPQHIAAYASGIMARRTTSMIYAAQSPMGIAADIRQLHLPAIVADAQDWTEETLAAARDVGSAAISISDGAAENAVERLTEQGAGPFRAQTPDVAIELLSSGTTGLPKRIPLSWKAITAAVEAARQAYAGSGSDAPQVMVHPLGNVAGLGYATPPLAYGQKLVLLEKFSAQAWAKAVRDYRPLRGTVPPAGIRMLLDADIAPEDLSSLTLIAVGGGKLDLDLHEAFEARFGIPILTAFGATEFGGVVANWSLDTYRKWGATKRGSAGLPSGDVSLRVVDRERFIPLPAGGVGLLEARVPRIGAEWIRTNDLASLDEDGFLFLHGRADGAINRGGFKVVPEMVAEAIRQHPAVADAAVVGITDQRLGAMPVAAVELAPGQSVEPERLREWLKDRLVAYQVPAHIRIMEALPRNASMKISLPDIEALFA